MKKLLKISLYSLLVPMPLRGSGSRCYLRNTMVVIGTFLLTCLSASPVQAVCQVVCPVIVGGTLTLLEKYGIDNSISGLWIGGALVLASLITVDWIKKWKSHRAVTAIIFILFYAATFIPLYFTGVIGDPAKELWGVDKTMIGVTIGSIFFYLGDYSYAVIKAKNGGHAWFPFQKAVMPVIPLIIFSVIFYFITQ